MLQRSKGPAETGEADVGLVKIPGGRSGEENTLHLRVGST